MSRFPSLNQAFLALAGSLLIMVQAPAASFSLESAADHAVKHNPSLQVARAALDEAAARVLQAGGFSNPEWETEVKPNLAGREFSVSTGISQRFPLTRRLHLEKAIAESALAIARLEVQLAERTLAFEVRAIGVQWLALHERQAILTKQTNAGRELAATATRTAATGESPPLEAAQLELAASQLSLETLQTKTRLATLTGSLRQQLGVAPGTPVTLRGTLAAPSVPPAAAIEPKRHLSWQMARARESTAQQSIQLVQANRWEDLTVGVGLERSHIDDAGVGMERETSAAVRFSLPLPLKRHIAGHLAETEAAARRTSLETAIAARLRAEAGAAHSEMIALATLHRDIVTRLLPQTKALEDQFSKLVKNGQAPPGEVLRTRQQRFALEISALEASRDFHLARLRYQAAAGF
jgi:cobalt-zinc-cadmium efflux system outer membrane protein